MTVSDPARSGGPADLIEAHDPWRPSRRLVLLLLGALALAAVVGAGLRVAGSRSAAQRADRALATTRLSAQLDGVVTVADSVTATVGVLTPRTRGLSVLGATVGGGWSLSSPLTGGPARLATIELSRAVTCTGAAVPEPVLSLVLSAGARQRSVRLALPPVGPAYAASARDACGGAGDLAAISGSTLAAVRRVGDHLEADLQLVNDSDHVVRVDGVSSEGLAVRVVGPLPLLLPARPYGRRSGALRVTRLHVAMSLTQCAGSGQIVSGAVTESTGLAVQVRRGATVVFSPQLRQLQVQLVLERCRHR